MQQPTRILRSLILVAIAATIAIPGTDTTHASDRRSPSGADQVLIERFVDRSDQFLKTLFLTRLDGTQRPLLAAPVGEASHNVHADWSPDGDWVVFEVLQSGDDNPAASVWIVGADGLNPRQVVACSSASCAQYAYPAWSQDGSELAMIRFGPYADGSCCTSDLVVFDIARSKRSGEWKATNEQVLASFGDADVIDTFDTYDAFYGPTWSPDGRQLAYLVDQYGVEDPYPLAGTRIAVVSRRGGDARFITPLALNAGDPDWHPCSDLIAFNTYPLASFQESNAPGNVYTIRPDGQRLKQLTTQSVDGSLRFGAVNWTPDGRGFTLAVARASNGVRLDSISLATLPAKGGIPTELGIPGVGPLRPRSDTRCKG